MKPTVTLIRAGRGAVFHIEREPRRARCGRQVPSDDLHRERGVDADVVRLARYPVCAECRRLTDHDRQTVTVGGEGEGARLF